MSVIDYNAYLRRGADVAWTMGRANCGYQRLSGGTLASLMAGLLSACTPQNAADANQPTTEQAATVASADEAPVVDPMALPEGPLTADHLFAYAKAALFYEPEDQFSPGTLDDSRLVDREFVFEVRPSEFPLEGLNFNYKIDEEELRLSVFLVGATHYQGKRRVPPDFHYLPFQHLFESENGSGQNAFGATMTFKSSDHYRFGVGVASDDATPGLFNRRSYGGYDALNKVIQMSPDEGRAATEGMKLRVTGKLANDPERKRVIACASDETVPSFDYPYNERWKECVLSAKFSMIEIVSPGHGVLASWGKE